MAKNTSFLADIQGFGGGGAFPGLVAPPKHEPHYKPDEKEKVQVGVVLPGLVPRKPRPNPPTVAAPVVKEPEPEPEVFEELTQHPLVTWLQNVGVELDIDAYVDNLIDGVGINTVDEIMLAEPSHEMLIEWGFADDSDRNKVYYAIHPEESPQAEDTPFNESREMELFEMVMSKMDNGTATEDDLAFFILMKAKLASHHAS